jgi:hypothetical protein
MVGRLEILDRAREQVERIYQHSTDDLIRRRCKTVLEALGELRSSILIEEAKNRGS